MNSVRGRGVILYEHSQLLQEFYKLAIAYMTLHCTHNVQRNHWCETVSRFVLEWNHMAAWHHAWRIRSLQAGLWYLVIQDVIKKKKKEKKIMLLFSLSWHISQNVTAFINICNFQHVLPFIRLLSLKAPHFFVHTW